MRYTGDYIGKTYFYQKDIKGSTMSLADEEGKGILAYEYDDFGETTKQGDEDFFNEICYTGAIYDESTGLYYLNARYYNPEDGRFLTQDTYRGEDNEPGTWHLYAYCANNPVNYVDPSGHVAITVITGVGLLVAGYAYIRYASARPKKVKVTKRYTVSKSYWDTHSHATYMSMSIISYWFIKKTVTKQNKKPQLINKNRSKKSKINQSKGGKQNLRRSGEPKNKTEEKTDKKVAGEANAQKRAQLKKNSSNNTSGKKKKEKLKNKRKKPKNTYW